MMDTLRGKEGVVIWIDDYSTIQEHAWRGLRSIIQEVVPGAVITAEPPTEVVLGNAALSRLLAKGFEDALASFKPVEMAPASEKYHQTIEEPWRRQGKRKGRRR